ncbi:MAG: serine/threonine-protein kinase [Thermogutta sp.]
MDVEKPRMADARSPSDSQENPPPATASGRRGGYRLEDQPTVITGGESSAFAPTTLERPAESNPRLAPGNTIGPYELLELIGGGGMGRVFRAYDVRLSRIVALKVLTSEQASDPQILARFQNEARSAARLSHPGIVQVFSAGEQDGIYYIAFEFVEGMNLRALVEQQGPLSVGESLHYTLQVAESLEHASARGIIHRDIKPSNIIVTREGRTKLIDLGLARMLQQNGRSSDLTTSGMTLGTFDYIAPEQARDPRLADIRSDIYSLGCTLFFMLSGQPPFPGGSVLQKLLQHQSEEPPNIRSIRPDVSEPVARVLRRMMAKSPRQRYQSAEELVQALRSLLGVRGPSLPAADGKNGKMVQKRLPLQQHLPWLVPVVMLLLSTLVLDWWWSQGAEETIYFGDDIQHRNGLFSPPLPNLPVRQGESETEQQRRTSPDFSKPAGATSPSARLGSSSQIDYQSGQSQKPDVGVPPVDTRLQTGVNDLTTRAKEAALLGTGVNEYPGTVGPPALDRSRSVNEGEGTETKETVASLPPSINAAMPPVTSDLISTNRATAASSPEGFPAAMSVSRDWVRVVDPTSKEPGSYRTLEAACQVALPGDEIRLNFDGPLLVEGCDLRARQLAIRAARGRFPELVFRPSDRTKLRGDSFWTLAASNVLFEDVAMRIEIPPELIANDWYLFRVTYNSVLELNRCVLSLVAISSAGKITKGSVNVGSFFAFHEDPRNELLVRSSDGVTENQSLGNVIRLQHCIIRGEGDVLRSASCQSTQVVLEKSFVSVAGRLLDMRGTERTPAANSSVNLQLRRLTIWAENGLIRQTQVPYQPHLQPVRVESENCIFVADPQSAFIEQHVPSVDVALRLLTWFGRRNFYEQFTRFWSVGTGTSHIAPLQLSFDYWKAYWRLEHEQDAAWGGVPWRGPLPLKVPAHTHRPTDFAIMDPAVDDVASDVADRAGCPINELPFVPPLDGYSMGIPSGSVFGLGKVEKNSGSCSSTAETAGKIYSPRESCKDSQFFSFNI